MVTATGAVVRASERRNADLFWALRGAGAGFGIVTRLWLRTHPEPGSVVQYSYGVSLGDARQTRRVFSQWQALAADAALDRRFSSQLVVPLGAVVTGTFYGSRKDLDATGIPARLPSPAGSLVLTDWLGSAAHVFESEALADLPLHFRSKLLALRRQDVLDADDADALFAFLDAARAPLVLIFNTEGGAVADVAPNRTAYPHRDKAFMYQAYAISLFGRVPDRHRRALEGVHDLIRRRLPRDASTYAGYVDPNMDRAEAQAAYWGALLPRLRQVKQDWDPADVFRNPQSVEPADAVRGTEGGL